MFPKARKNKSAPKLLGTYYMYTLKAPLDVLVPDSDAAPAATSSNREPCVLMHMPKPGAHATEAQVVVPEPTTAVDLPVTLSDAAPTGNLGAASDDSLEVVTGLVERISLPGAASPAVAAGAAGAASCAHCGKGPKKKGAELKRCSRCKKVSYCGAECQKAGWKGHKKTCTPHLSVQKVIEQIQAAEDPFDWRGVLKWEGRMEEVLEVVLTASGYEAVLLTFVKARMAQIHATDSMDEHAPALIKLVNRRIEVLGTLERFRDQGTRTKP